jgi:hypothetical protein
LGLGQRQGWEVAGVRRSSVGACSGQVDPFGHVNGWSIANPSATSRVSTWPISSPVGAYRRVRQLGILEQRQDPGRIGVQLTEW